MYRLRNFDKDCLLVREKAPLVHNIANYVAMNTIANSLLAIGASPIMSAEALEMEDLVGCCDSLVINTGCPEQRSIEAMYTAAAAVLRLGRPWLLDPVGVGASKLRMETCLRLVREFRPSAIRGNASEIISLAGDAGVQSKGVDAAVADSAAIPYAIRLAQESGAVVAVSGAVDFITDGESEIYIAGGSPLMPRVTAMGCTASAVAGAFLAVESDRLEALGCAMALMSVAGEEAALAASGTGSFLPAFIDVLSNFNPRGKVIEYGKE